ncbi:hypothetical protein [Bosea sp. 117]|uniref:hypothetical protein n=1 Tax=Bosea sp. 117 TaxID=1125973 RepID=UPI000690B226|nr:hypothetical protein [Bosea sp. 117]
MLRSLAIVPLVAVPVLAAPSVLAHDAPSGWPYPPACCSTMDCYPINGSDIDEGRDGIVVKATGELIAYWSRKLKPSGDGQYHRCSHQGDRSRTTICLFLPAGS